MNKFPVPRALIVVILILALSACAEFDANQDAAFVPEPGILVETILDSEDARETLLKELGEQLREPSTEAPATSSPLVYERTFIDLYQQANPSVVNIQVTAEINMSRNEKKSPSSQMCPNCLVFQVFLFPISPTCNQCPNKGRGQALSMMRKVTSSPTITSSLALMKSTSSLLMAVKQKPPWLAQIRTQIWQSSRLMRMTSLMVFLSLSS